MKVAVIALALLLAALQYRLWFGQGSLPAVSDLRARVTRESQENAKLAARNQRLEHEVASLKHSDQAIESRARSELGMIKGNETFYLVVKR